MDEVDSKFICPICCEILKKPLLMTCGHRFCQECFEEFSKRTQVCPVCRKNIEVRSCKEDNILEREIASGTVVCWACGQRLSMLHFNTHATTCAKRKVPLSQLVPNGQSSQPSPQPRVNRSTFVCPLCGMANLDCQGLLEHCNTRHRDQSHARVVCPVCASMPWGNPHQYSNNFIQHLNLRHKFEYDTYVDYEQDDDEALQAALEASLFQK